MFTDKRLTTAYNNAKLEYFDNNSKYIFFSDIHRGDDSASDVFARNQNVFVHALDYYYNNDYVYVELGDGDDMWEHSKYKHIRYAHSDVFIVMKKLYDKGRLILMYGNHNIYLKDPNFVKKNLYYYFDEYNKNMTELFHGITPQEALVLKHKNTGQELFVVHGHQGDLFNDKLWYVSMFSLRYFWRYLHVVGFTNPASPSKNAYKRHKIERKYKKWIRLHKRVLICGHTHRARFPKKGELPYFNTGCCIHSKKITGIEIVNGKILMVDWRIRAEDNGVLKIVRTVVRGPVPLEKFDFRKNKFIDIH